MILLIKANAKTQLKKVKVWPVTNENMDEKVVAISMLTAVLFLVHLLVYV